MVILKQFNSFLYFRNAIRKQIKGLTLQSGIVKVYFKAYGSNFCDNASISNFYATRISI